MVVSALLITLMMPRRAVMDIHFAPGETWEAETLVAPFDIPIYKNAEQIGQERKNLLENYQPLFRMDTTVGTMQMRDLKAELEANPEIPQAQQEQILRTFRHIYSTGIVDDADRAAYVDRVVRIDSAHILRTVPLADLFTPGTAAAYLATQNVPEPGHYARFISPSLIYDQTLNTKLREQLTTRQSVTEGIIRSGDVIVAHGQMVDRHTARLLDSFLQEYEVRLGEGKHGAVLFLARFLMMLCIMAASFIFFKYFTPQPLFENWRAMLFVFLLFVLMAAWMGAIVRVRYLSPYLVPLPVVPLLVLAFFNTRVAVVTNLMTVLMAAFFVRYNFEYFTVNLLGGMTAIFVARHHYHRHSIFKTVAAVMAVEILAYFSFQWIATGTFDVSYQGVIWFVISAFLMLAFYQLVYIFERIFGFVSDITLLELSDTNEPLLQLLAEKAPGTFQHAVQVASLAESAAKEIGANPLLARAGALYHDIGKLKNPYYFIENQTGGFNPHSMLTPEQSATLVRSHVTEGVALARKYNLPSVIQEFITGHHGTSKIYYFYAEEMQLHGKVEHPEEFIYPGPNPVRREVAICMIADAVEAAARSLKNYDRESIDELVEKIVDRQVSEKQFSYVNLTFAEVTRIKELFKTRLNNIYHGRVAYPKEATA